MFHKTIFISRREVTKKQNKLNYVVYLKSNQFGMALRLCYLSLFLLFVSCKDEEPLETQYVWESILVTASAYNSTVAQTDGNPHLTAFGDSIKPGMKYIAVSRDLLRKGLNHNTPVVIEGFEGLYLVKDKMHGKWRNKIDIYMGNDIKAARQWGRRKVRIDYRLPIKRK